MPSIINEIFGAKTKREMMKMKRKIFRTGSVLLESTENSVIADDQMSNMNLINLDFVDQISNKLSLVD